MECGAKVKNHQPSGARFDGCEVYRARLYGDYHTVAGGGTSNDSPFRGRAAYLKRLIERHFPAERTTSILDLGCGHGALLHFAREAGYFNLEGIDRSAQQVSAARGLGVEEVHEGDLIAALAQSADDSRDVVISFDLIEHLRKEEVLLVADEVYRVLRFGGRWIVHTSNGESPFGPRVRYGDFTHETAFTCVSLGQVMRAAGFAQVACYEDAPVVHGVRSAVRWLLWQPLRAGLRLWLAIETGESGARAVFSQNLLAVATK